MNSIKQFFTVTALLMILNGSASALDVKVENLTQAKVVLAFSYLDEVDNEWVVDGWYNVDSKQTAEIKLPSNNDIYYL